MIHASRRNSFFLILMIMMGNLSSTFAGGTELMEFRWGWANDPRLQKVKEMLRCSPSLTHYHLAHKNMKFSPFYRLVPGTFTKEELDKAGELGGSGLKTLAGMRAVLVELTLSPVTLISSPVIALTRYKAHKFEKMLNLLNDVYFDEFEGKKIDRLLNSLKHIYPENPAVQDLGRGGLKNIIKSLDKKQVFSRCENENSLFGPVELLSYQDFKRNVPDFLEGKTVSGENYEIIDFGDAPESCSLCPEEPEEAGETTALRRKDELCKSCVKASFEKIHIKDPLV